MALISGGRINIWNVVKKQFEVVHPETETARITDFADGIVQKLALTSTMTAVTALQTDSWFGKLLKMVLTASGVRYNIADNGYICFGSFWGGLIIQWIYDIQNTNELKGAYTINIPIAMNLLGCATNSTGDDSTNIVDWSTNSITVKSFQSHITSLDHQVRRPFHAILIGKN